MLFVWIAAALLSSSSAAAEDGNLPDARPYIELRMQFRLRNQVLRVRLGADGKDSAVLLGYGDAEIGAFPIQRITGLPRSFQNAALELGLNRPEFHWYETNDIGSDDTSSDRLTLMSAGQIYILSPGHLPVTPPAKLPTQRLFLAGDRPESVTLSRVANDPKLLVASIIGLRLKGTFLGRESFPELLRIADYPERIVTWPSLVNDLIEFENSYLRVNMATLASGNHSMDGVNFVSSGLGPNRGRVVIRLESQGQDQVYFQSSPDNELTENRYELTHYLTGRVTFLPKSQINWEPGTGSIAQGKHQILELNWPSTNGGFFFGLDNELIVIDETFQIYRMGITPHRDLAIQIRMVPVPDRGKLLLISVRNPHPDAPAAETGTWACDPILRTLKRISDERHDLTNTSVNGTDGIISFRDKKTDFSAYGILGGPSASAQWEKVKPATPSFEKIQSAAGEYKRTQSDEQIREALETYLSRVERSAGLTRAARNATARSLGLLDLNDVEIFRLSALMVKKLSGADEARKTALLESFNGLPGLYLSAVRDQLIATPGPSRTYYLYLAGADATARRDSDFISRLRNIPDPGSALFPLVEGGFFNQPSMEDQALAQLMAKMVRTAIAKAALDSSLMNAMKNWFSKDIAHELHYNEAYQILFPDCSGEDFDPTQEDTRG